MVHAKTSDVNVSHPPTSFFVLLATPLVSNGAFVSQCVHVINAKKNVLAMFSFQSHSALSCA